MNKSQIVFLKPTTTEDFEEYYQVRSDPTDIYWNGYTSKPERESFQLGFLKRTASARFENPGDRRNYLIQTVEDNTTVGFLQLIMRENAVEIGYSVSQPYQRKGYASAALNMGIELAKEFRFPIKVSIRDDNIASQKVALRNGFLPTENYEERKYPVVGRIKLRDYLLVDTYHG